MKSNFVGERVTLWNWVFAINMAVKSGKVLSKNYGTRGCFSIFKFGDKHVRCNLIIQDLSAEREFWDTNMKWMFLHVFKVIIDLVIFSQGYQPEKWINRFRYFLDRSHRQVEQIIFLLMCDKFLARRKNRTVDCLSNISTIRLFPGPSFVCTWGGGERQRGTDRQTEFT